MASSEGYVTTEDGIRLFYRTLGDGPQTVIIPNGMYLLEDFEGLAKGRTLIFYDLRNRGRSDRAEDGARPERGIHNDVDDLETVRRHFGLGQLDLIGHSYIGLMIILYAMKHGDHVGRAVQVGPMEPYPGKKYPAHLTGADADDTLREVMVKLAELQACREPEDLTERCRNFWSVLARIYVTGPADAGRVDWGRCELPNERGFMKYWIGTLLPSLRALELAAEDFAKVRPPVLTIHGTRDRSAPYGGAREWALLLPDARLVTVEEAGHGPWIEAPEKVFGAIEAFLGGGWPEGAERVEVLDPAQLS